MLVFKRNKRKYITNFSLRDVHKFYKEQYNSSLNSNIFHNIIKDFFTESFYEIITKGGEFIMPYRLGSIRLRKRKRNIKINPDGTINRSKMPVDWAATKKMWEEKYPLLTSEEIANIPVEEKGLKYNWNEHTDRYQFRFYWEKIISNVPNRNFYTFKAPRTYKQFLSKALKENKDIKYLHFQ